MAFNTPNNFTQPGRTRAGGNYFWRIAFCFIIALAVAFTAAHLRVEPSYRAEVKLQIIPVEVSNPYLSNASREKPLSLQAALLCERLLTKGEPEYKKALTVEAAGLGGIINLSCQADDQEEAKQLLASASNALHKEHAAGQGEKRQALAKQLQAKLTKVELRQAPLEQEIISHLDSLEIPEETRATILKEGLVAKTITDYLKNYREDFSAREKKLELAIEKENQELEKIRTLLADPDNQEIFTEETVFVDSPEGEGLRARLTQLEKELRAYLKTSTELHPFVKSTRAEIIRTRAKLKAAGCLKKIYKKSSPNPDILVWEAAEKPQLAAIIALKKEWGSLEKDFSQWNRYAADAPLRLALAGKMQQLAEERQLLAEPLTLLNQDEPVTWSKLELYSPVTVATLEPKPDYQTALIYGAIAGVVLSFILVRLSQYADNSIKNADHASQYFSTPVLASIPEAKTKGSIISVTGNSIRTGGAFNLVLIMAVIITITAIIFSQRYNLDYLKQQAWNKIEQVFSSMDLEDKPDEAVSGRNQEHEHEYLLGAVDQPVEEEIR